MQIVYLPSTSGDLLWFRQYYNAVFPVGDQKARKHFKATERLLIGNPFIGHIVPGYDDIRELQIARIPFAFIYRVTETKILILRVWDNRRESN